MFFETVIYIGMGEAEEGQEDLVIYQGWYLWNYLRGRSTAAELLEQGAQEILSFGPALIQEGEISVTADDEVGKAMAE